MNKKFPNYIKYILSNIGFLFVYLFFFRLIFFFFISNFDSVSREEIQTAFSYGIRFDLKLVILSYFPLSLFILSKNYLFFKKKVFRKIAITYHILLYLLLTIIYLIDIQLLLIFNFSKALIADVIGVVTLVLGFARFTFS